MKLKAREVECLGPWADERQSQDQTPGSLSLKERDHSSSFDLIRGYQDKSAPRIELRSLEAIGKPLDQSTIQEKGRLAGTPVHQHCSLLEVRRHCARLLPLIPLV